jgi:glycosyltransferase involved in cell wall biosynthesis
MKIVHFIEALDPRDGGPPMVAARLAAEQSRQGHNVTLLTSYTRTDTKQLPDVFARFAGIETVSRRCLDAPRLRDRLGRRARQKLTETVEDADVLHAHSLWDPLFLYASSACRRNHTTLCLTPHGLLTRWSLDQKSLKKRLALVALWKGALQKVDLFHFLTEHERADLELLGLRRPCAVIPNGVDPEEFATPVDDTELQRVLPEKSARHYVLFLGRIAYMKGVDILCDAFASLAARIPDVDLVLAGPDYDGYRAQIEQQIRRLGLGHRIHLVGPVFGSRKIALLARASCLCQPSRNEGFSVTVLEALACGTPVVISTECHFPQVSTSGAGIVTAVSPAETAAALETLLLNAQIASIASEAARRLIDSGYTVHATASQLIARYVSVAGAQPAIVGTSQPGII